MHIRHALQVYALSSLLGSGLALAQEATIESTDVDGVETTVEAAGHTAAPSPTDVDTIMLRGASEDPTVRDDFEAFRAALAIAEAHERNPSTDAGEYEAALAIIRDYPSSLPVQITDRFPGQSQAALEQWASSWREKPDLVSLNDGAGAILEAQEAVEARLQLLGTKVLSNREWSDYWQTQATHAQALASALDEAPGDQGQESEILREWADLALSKVENQQAYLEAIRAERDSQEAYLETLLDAEEQAEPALVPPEEPNPYESRSWLINRLERQVEVQSSRKAEAERRIHYIKQQLQAESQLIRALEADEALAQTEAEIAKSTREALPAWPWPDGSIPEELNPLLITWMVIDSATQDKARKISEETAYYKKRQRTRQVELELTQSEVEYRGRRVAEVQAELDAESSFETLMVALWDTIADWFTHQAWRIFIALFVIWLGIRFALRMINRGATIILSRADDDPDEDDAGDQRRKTLADVFVGLARISVYIVGGLVALEQIGINTGPIMGSVAILGLAISFGSQNLVRDVVNGFFILLENQYAVGDVVQLNGKSGTVEKITIRSTWVREYSGSLHAIPNGTINLVSNMTRDWSRAVCHIGVSYDADLAKVREVVERVSSEIKADPDWSEVIEEGPDFVGVTELADSAVTVRIAAKTDAGSHWGLGREMNRRFKEAFAAAGIEIPYPQQVVHHVNAAG